MNIIILGPQGSGKGTQAKMLSEKLGLFYLEVGGLLRKEITKGTSLGEEIFSLVDGGKLVPDEVLLKVITPSLNEETFRRGIIFDGFPRIFSQIDILESKLNEFNAKIDRVILLNISRRESIRRLSARRNCPKCGRIYNLITLPPKIVGVCDDDGAELITRKDETPEAIEERLNIFEKESFPIVEYFQKQGLVIYIDGEQPIDVIFKQILEKLHLE
jgi:adenylate kinase